MNSIPHDESKDYLAKRALERIDEKPDLLEEIRERIENDEIVNWDYDEKGKHP